MRVNLRDQLPRLWLVAAFMIVHAWLVWVGLTAGGQAFGDITNAYWGWVTQLNSGLPWYGIWQNWVYPYPNLLFILAPALLPMDYRTAWLIMAAVVNVTALLALVGIRGRASMPTLAAGWSWCALLLLLGPVSIGRLDTISVAVGVWAVVLWSASRHRWAAAVAAFAVWIKVWPVALILGFLSDKTKRIQTLMWSVGVGLAFLVAGFLVGKPESVLSFITLQNSRGLQVEAPISSLWLWNNAPESNVIYFDPDLITFQISAPGVELVASLMGWVQLGALGITAFLGYRASGAGAPGNQRSVIATVSLTACLDLIVFNKVGSPQYYGWLVVPMIMFALWQVSKWRLVLLWLLAVALLTQLVYPVFYDAIVFQASPLTWLLVSRNLLVIGLLVYANVKLTQLSNSSLSNGPTLSRSIKKPS